MGDPGNVLAFRFACSSVISPLEHYVMDVLFPGDNGTSITIDLGREIFNGQMPGLFMSNGYLVMKSSVENMFLIFDPDTGILRDVMIFNETVFGDYCFSDMQTEWAFDLAEDLLSILPSVNLNIFNSISNISIYLGSITATGSAFEWGVLGLSRLVWPIAIITAPIVFLEAVKPYAVGDAGSMGYYNTANWLKKSLKDQMWDVVIQFMGYGNGPGSGVYDESNKYLKNNPNVQRNQNSMKEFYNNLWGSVNGAIDIFLPDDRAPTLEDVGNAFLNTGRLYLDDNERFIKQGIKALEEHKKNMKILTSGDSSDPLIQYGKLGQALGVALLLKDYSQAIQIIIAGYLCVIGESIAETLEQKERGENLINNTNTTGG